MTSQRLEGQTAWTTLGIPGFSRGPCSSLPHTHRPWPSTWCAWWPSCAAPSEEVDGLADRASGTERPLGGPLTTRGLEWWARPEAEMVFVAFQAARPSVMAYGTEGPLARGRSEGPSRTVPPQQRVARTTHKRPLNVKDRVALRRPAHCTCATGACARGCGCPVGLAGGQG